MHTVAAESVPLKSPSIATQIAAFRYRVDVGSLINGDGGAHFRERIAAFCNAADFPLSKHAKGGNRIVNARPFVAMLEWSAPHFIDATILFGTAGTLKPMDLLGAVLGLDTQHARALAVHKIATLHHPGRRPAESVAAAIA
jgi:hypothetical protein